MNQFRVSCFGSLNAYISGTRQDIKKQSTAFIHVFHALSYDKIKTFRLWNVLKEQLCLVLNQFVHVGDVSGDTSPIIWQRVMADQQILCTSVGPVWKQCLLVIDCISRNVANINKLVQDKTKLFFQNILQHDLY